MKKIILAILLLFLTISAKAEFAELNLTTLNQVGLDNVSPGIKGDDDFIGTSYKKAGDIFSVLVEDVNPSVNGDNDITAITSLNCLLGDLTLLNPSPVEFSFSSGISFDGSNDYLILNPAQDFPTKEITTTFWIMTSNSGQGLISYASTTSDNDYLIFRAANLNVYVMGSGVSTGVSVNDNKWHFVAVSWRSNNGELKVYKDSVLSYSGILATGSSITTSGSLVFGQDQNSVGGDFDSSQAFNGQLSNIQIYKRILGQEEITLNYKSPYQISNPGGIFGFWRLDDSTVNSSSVLNAIGKKWNTASNNLLDDSSLTSMLTNFDFNTNSGWVNQYSYKLAKYNFSIPSSSSISQIEKLSCTASDLSGNLSNLELGGVFISRSNPQVTTVFSQGNSLMSGDNISITVTDNTPDTSILLNPTNVSASLDSNPFPQSCSIIPTTFSKAVNLDGLDDYIDFGNQLKLRDLPVKTISLWTKLDIQAPVSQNNSYLISKGDVWYLATDPSNSRNIFVHNFSGGNGKWSFPQFSTNSWHHIAIVYDKQSALNDPEIYVDGILQTINEITTPSGSASTDSGFNLRLSKSESTLGYVDGLIDDFQIYGRGFTPEEIIRLFQNPGKIINARGLIAWFRFDKLEDTDSNAAFDNVRDYSGNLNNGVLNFGSSLSNSIVNSDLLNSIDGVTGTCNIQITSTNPSGPSDVTNKSLTVNVSNANGLSGSDTTTINLSRNRAPQNPVILSATISGSDAGTNSPYVVKDGQTLLINFSSSDLDTQDMITLSTPTIPSVGTFTVGSTNNPGTATYTLTPSSSQVGMTIAFTVRSQDNYSAVSAQDLNVSIVVIQSTQNTSPTPSTSAQPSSTPLPTAIPILTVTPLPTATPLPTVTPLPTLNPQPTPSSSSTPSIPSSTPIPTTSIDVNSLPSVKAEFPELPDFFADSFGLNTDSFDDGSILIAGSPASFTIDPNSDFYMTYLSNIQDGQGFQIKIVDSKNQEFTVTASIQRNPDDPSQVSVNISKVPGAVVSGVGSLIFLSNGNPIAKINAYIIRSETLSDGEIEQLQPQVQSVVVIRNKRRVKFIILGKNFFRKTISIGGGKEINTGKVQSSVSVIPNSKLKRKSIKVLNGKKIIVAKYVLVGDKNIPNKITIRVINPYGQIFKSIDIPPPATGIHERSGF